MFFFRLPLSCFVLWKQHIFPVVQSTYICRCAAALNILRRKAERRLPPCISHFPLEENITIRAPCRCSVASWEEERNGGFYQRVPTSGEDTNKEIVLLF